jgi:carnitine O-acetyltransferase
MAADSSTVATKPWPTKMVESHGDYRDEAWLEELDHNKTTTYQNQSSLPKLPVPSVEETLQRFLPTALPLVESKTEQKALEEAVARFPAQAQQLQERLLKKASDPSNQKSSWLQHWWNTLGYLQVRDSVVINVSYYFHFADDTTLGKASNNGSNSSTSTVQIQRASAILYAAGQYRNQVASGALAPETLGRKKIPLCMTAYKYMLHACRIPRLHQDSYRIYDPSVYKHAVVACRGRFYKIPLIDKTTGRVLSVSTLEAHLETIMELAGSSQSEGSGHDFGYLTGDNRDVWATARTALLELPGMEDALEVLESGCVLVNLDTVSDLDAGKTPVSRAQCGKQFLYGNGNASNRWFDKSVQLVVCPNGKAGLLGEHSMMDGMPVVGLANHIVNTSYQQALEESGSSSLRLVETYGGVSDIFDGVSGSLTPEIQKMIETSKQNFEEWTKGKHDLDVQSFRGYGADFMKKSGFSPDAFAQMAMQVATSRLFGKQAGTYEATQTRIFEHGRTETTRTVSPASAAFVKSLLEPSSIADLTADDKIALLKGACQTHAKYIGNAAKGLGVDRHFLGLSLLAKDGEVMPDLYSDPVFVRSKRWRVSTSNLTHPKLENWGYGEVVPDGVGLSYSVHKNHLVFGITALKEHGGWPERLSQYLEDTLVEMKLLIEESAANNSKDAATPLTRSKM